MSKKKEAYADKISRSLGSANSYAVSTDKFDPELLNPIPREDARQELRIKGTEFKGIDVWRCHEATFLTNSGIPVAGTLKFAYDSSSKDMIESKSMKLYLNSFDMCKMGKTIDEAIKAYEFQVGSDLSTVLDTTVSVKFHESGADKNVGRPFDDYVDMYEYVKENESKIKITDYKAKKKHIEFIPTKEKGMYEVYKLSTNILRSRCRHTKQKDTGTAFIYIEVENATLNITSLFKEIVALREVNEFHEFCAEKLYTSIMKSKYVKRCMVGLLYSRRGSLDINPVRCTDAEMIPTTLGNVDFYTKKTQGQ